MNCSPNIKYSTSRLISQKALGHWSAKPQMSPLSLSSTRASHRPMMCSIRSGLCLAREKAASLSVIHSCLRARQRSALPQPESPRLGIRLLWNGLPPQTEGLPYLAIASIRPECSQEPRPLLMMDHMYPQQLERSSKVSKKVSTTHSEHPRSTGQEKASPALPLSSSRQLSLPNKAVSQPSSDQHRAR